MDCRFDADSAYTLMKEEAVDVVIADIVMTQSDYSLDDIRVVEVQ